MSDVWKRIVVWALAVAQAVAVVLGASWHARAYAPYAGPGDGWFVSIGTTALFSLGYLAYSVVGAAIVTRRPGNTIGWLLVGTGAASAIGLAGFTYRFVAVVPAPADAPLLALLGAWISPVASTLTVVLGFVLVPLLFPDGRLPSSRWRAVGWLAAVFVTGELLAVFRPRVTFLLRPIGADPIEVVDIANPLGWEGVQPIAGAMSSTALPVLLVLASSAFAAVWVRIRRSVGVERQQMKWFVAAAMVLLVGLTALTVVTAAGLEERTGLATALLVIGAFGAYPVAIGVAILRYRLYEIDRIISRTVAYGLTLTVLGAVYLVGVLGFSAVVSGLTGREGSDLVVALATLAVVALFRPIRTRIRTAVDRRFNRTGFEARRAVEGFAHRVRDQVDLPGLEREVARTAAASVQPMVVSVWLAERDS